MKKFYKFHLKNLISIGKIVALIIIVNSSKINAQSFNLFAVTDLLRVFEDGYN